MNQTLRVLIGTPAGGGMVSVQYLLSLLEVFQKVMQMKHQIFIRNNLRIAKEQGVINEPQLANLQALEQENLIDLEIGLYTLSNESLLSRGRNHIAAVAIRQGWHKLMFIDADAKWTFDQFMSVVCNNEDFVAGACPLKCFPISLNYLPFEDDEHYYKNAIRSVDSFLKMKEGHKTKFVPIAFIGTAFCCYSRNALLRMAEVSEEYQYPNPATGHLHTHWNIFATNPMNGKFMSEDWTACNTWRSLGGNVMLDTDVIISHVGSHTFGPEQAHITHKTEGLNVAQGSAPVKREA